MRAEAIAAASRLAIGLASGLPSDPSGFSELVARIAADPNAKALTAALLLVGAVSFLETAQASGAERGWVH